MRIDRLDHLVLTVADIDATVDLLPAGFWALPAVTFGAGRTALAFGHSKINLHRAGHEFEPKAFRPAPGSADLCLIAADPLEQVIEELAAREVPIEVGPVERAGATGTILSVYFRDPDQNLIEVSNYLIPASKTASGHPFRASQSRDGLRGCGRAGRGDRRGAAELAVGDGPGGGAVVRRRAGVLLLEGKADVLDQAVGPDGRVQPGGRRGSRQGRRVRCRCAGRR